MDTFQTKAAKSNHVVTLYIHLVSRLQQGTMNSLIKCVYEFTVCEWAQTSDK